MAYSLTPEKEALLRREWMRTNVQMPELCRLLECSEKTVRRVAKSLSLGSRPVLIREWPEARVAELAKHHRDGLSAGQIAKRMGGGLTRNAIIGKLNRLGLLCSKSRTRATNAAVAARAKRRPSAPGTMRPQAKAFGETRVPPAKPKLSIAGNGMVFEQAPVDTSQPQIKAAAWAPLPGVDPISRDLAGPHVCKWPITVDGDELGFCCGAVATEKAYCKSHARRAVSPNQPKKPKAQVDHRFTSEPQRRRAA